MSWQILTSLSVLLYSGNNLLHRVLMKDDDSNPYTQTIAFYGIVGIFALIISIFRGGFQYKISSEQTPYFILIAIFAALTSVLGFKALQSIESSENSILISSSKLWVVLGAFTILHEEFSIIKFIGAVIVLVGIAIAQYQNHKFIFNNGVVFALLASISYAITEITSFFILRNFDANSFAVYTNWLPIIVILIINPKSFSRLSFYLRQKNAIYISIVSLSDLLATLFLFNAYQVGRNASQIAPIMATQTIISVLLAIVILKERNNISKKILGGLLVVVGVILIL